MRSCIDTYRAPVFTAILAVDPLCALVPSMKRNN